MTDAEVLQELLHRYRAIGRLDAMEAASDALLSLVDEVYPIDRDDVLAARRLLRGSPPSPRVTRSTWPRCGGTAWTTSSRFDSGFDAVGGLRRLPG